jgi:hypothetical protein
MVAWLLVMTGCSSIMDEYERARARALAEPGPVPASWVADARLDLSLPLIDTLVQALVAEQGGLSGARSFTGPLGVNGTVTPELQVKELRVVRSQTCAECLTLLFDIGGSASFTLLGASGTLPISASATADVALESALEGEVWEVRARIADLRDVDLDVGGAGAGVGPLVAPVLSAWLQSGFLDGLPQIPLVSVDTAELPLRALRVAPTNGTVRVEMLSRVPTPGQLEPGGAGPASGWSLSVAQDSLLALARAQGFEQGPVGYDVVVEPTALAVDGGAFTLGLRLWRTSGAGWWRDYTVTGALAVAGDGIGLTANGVEEGDKSPGALFVDPLAALAEGRILTEIEQAVATTLPGGGAADIAGVQTALTVTSVRGVGGALELTGSLTLDAPKARPDGPDPRRAPRRRR